MKKKFDEIEEKNAKMRFVSVEILNEYFFERATAVMHPSRDVNSPEQKVLRMRPRVWTLMIRCGNTSGWKKSVAVWLQRKFQTKCSWNAHIGSVGWFGACGMRGLEEGRVEAFSSTGKIVGLAPGVGSTGVGKAGGPSPLTLISSATTAAGRGDVTPPGTVRHGRGAARRPAWRRQARGGGLWGVTLGKGRARGKQWVSKSNP